MYLGKFKRSICHPISNMNECTWAQYNHIARGCEVHILFKSSVFKMKLLYQPRYNSGWLGSKFLFHSPTMYNFHDSTDTL